MLLKSSWFLVNDVSVQSFRPTFNGQVWPLKVGPTDCTETSVTKYQNKLRNIQKEWRPQLQGGGRLKSRIQRTFKY